MSRSRRRSPCRSALTCDSEKQEKRIANRTLRRVVKNNLKQGKELPLLREVSNRWDWGKDNVYMWFGDKDSEHMRK